MDIAETGWQIGEKLFVFLDEKKRKEVKQFVLEQDDEEKVFPDPCTVFPTVQSLTEIYVDDICFCKEYRLIRISELQITLTAKEFDLLAVLIFHPMNVFTYEMLAELVWQDEYYFYFRKTICNHIAACGIGGRRDTVFLSAPPTPITQKPAPTTAFTTRIYITPFLSISSTMLALPMRTRSKRWFWR